VRTEERGQGVVEAAIILPVLLLLVFGLLGVERVLHAETGVQAVAHDAARTAALANSAAEAAQRGAAAGLATAGMYRLNPADLALTVDAQDFRRGGRVASRAKYVVHFSDLPLLGWASLPVSSTNLQPVDRYRAFPGGQP
jgi:Flp pilus assembly protein TadG